MHQALAIITITIITNIDTIYKCLSAQFPFFIKGYFTRLLFTFITFLKTIILIPFLSFLILQFFFFHSKLITILFPQSLKFTQVFLIYICFSTHQSKFFRIHFYK